jgi:5-methylcytosine-specific restriction endonuclease McrA
MTSDQDQGDASDPVEAIKRYCRALQNALNAVDLASASAYPVTNKMRGAIDVLEFGASELPLVPATASGDLTMPWTRKTPEERRQDARNYGTAEYKRNRAVVLRRAGGRCECTGECGKHTGDCARRDRPLQTDHIIPASQGGGPQVENLRALCGGPGSCHAAITAQQGKGFRSGGNRCSDPAPRQSTLW